jgi:pimeloyl-ACP methyl ester carboxylesterase/mannose-6-phosphate isomerase-like protein (cupin superfamily)
MADTASTNAYTVIVDGIGPVPVTVTQRGEGRPFLLLHGGAGSQSVDGFAELLSTAEPARVLTPLHPGFGGTPRPEGLDSMPGLAKLYVQLIDDLGLTGVTVIGNSIGGWIAAEIAVLGSPRVSDVILVDAGGLQIDEHPIVDFFSLSMDQVADLSYFRPDAFRIDLNSMPDAVKAIMGANRAALATYGGNPMSDATLLGRLSAVTVPVLVVWGAADRIVPIQHGRAYTGAIPGAEFRLISDAGHLPQLETPDELLPIVWGFATAHGHDHIVSLVGPGGGEKLPLGPIQMRILEDGQTTAHRLGIGEITIPPHTDGPPQHRHARHDEGFYVVSGAARFTVGEQAYDAPAGTMVMIPPGAPHTFANPGDEPAVVLNTFTPDLYVQYFRDVRDLLASGQPPSGKALADIMTRYATTPAHDFAS